MGAHIGWGILGCGRIATHAVAPAIGWSSNGRLVAVASRDERTATSKSRALGAPRAYAPYDALLADPEIDAVYIGLPNGLHEHWALRAAEAGKHVLCEKSLTLSLASAERLSQAFAERGLRLAEAFMYRHHPQWNVVRGLLRERAIGDVRLLRASFGGRCAEGDHRWSAQLGGGALFDVVCYPLDVARFLLEAEPLAVTAARHMQGGVDAATVATLEFASGVLATVAGSFESDGHQHLVVSGSEGHIEVRRPFDPGWSNTDVIVTRHGEQRRIDVGGANHFLHQVEHFARTVLDPSARSAPAEDGLANARVLDAVVRAHELGTRVAIASPDA